MGEWSRQALAQAGAVGSLETRPIGSEGFTSNLHAEEAGEDSGVRAESSNRPGGAIGLLEHCLLPLDPTWKREVLKTIVRMMRFALNPSLLVPATERVR